MRPLLFVSAVLACVLVACGDDDANPATGAGDQDPPQRWESERREFVGMVACARCHEDETTAWRGSHHDLAMQPADESTVLGDFDDTTVEHRGARARFFKKDGRFFAHTDGPDGVATDFEVSYAFGVTPLQQYLVKFPDGRMQVLPFCWDSRAEDAGGQRWFHIYQDESIPHTDALHWTGVHQNWNFMCADCHSTDLQRHFDVENNRFATTWSEIDVACEACHGPGSAHVDWAQRREARGETEPHGGTATEMGLVASLRGLPDAAWVLDKTTGQAKRAGPLPAASQVETCARCHARRTAIADHGHGAPLLDAVIPALLREGLYHADGQILDEVYVWGSFRQSKMHMHGVVCTDCHEPHSGGLRTTGNGLCYRCHAPETFDVFEHHHHKAGTPGANCVDCHMPHTTYMVVDPRRDHSIRVPRPDLTTKIGTPNACNKCHTDKTAEWATEAIDSWYPEPKRPEHYGEVFAAARKGELDAGLRLAALTGNKEQPGIVRASAIGLLAERGYRELSGVAYSLSRDADPLIRHEVARALDGFEEPTRAELGGRLVRDPIRAVRIEAARRLAGMPTAALEGRTRAARDQVLEEYVAAQMVNADRAFAHVNIGVLRAIEGRLDEAEKSYATAIRLDRRSRDAWANLADVYRERGQDAACLKTLRDALKILPRDPGIHHALGLAYVRGKQSGRALGSLETAWSLGPRNPQWGYVYGVALTSTDGRRREGLDVLESVHARHPTHRPTLQGLVSISQQMREFGRALRYARVWSALDPDDPDLADLVKNLEKVVRGG